MPRTFGQILKGLRGTRTQAQLAVELNSKYNLSLNKGMISKWENDKDEPRMQVVRCLADFFNVSLDYLLGLTDNPYRANISTDKIVMVPIFGRVAAGRPILADQVIEGYLPVMSSVLDPDKDYFFLKVRGESMNLRFQNGSYVLVERTSSVENGQICVVRVDGEDATVKKVSIGNHTITLIPLSSSAEFTPTTYSTSDDIAIIGRVIQTVGDVEY